MRQTQSFGKYLVIDTETTGLKAFENGVIQLSALALDRELIVIDEFNEYIKPPKWAVYDPESLKVNGITQEQIDQGLSYEQACRAFISFIKDNFGDTKPIMVAQFFPFDYSFLDRMFEEVQPGIGLFQNICSRDYLDTKSIANALNLRAEIENKPTPFPSTSLANPLGLKSSLGIDLSKYKPHDALEDCKATRDVLEKLVNLFGLKF
jgi:DNA polymerase III epsilon subunit-like protein